MSYTGKKNMTGEVYPNHIIYLVKNVWCIIFGICDYNQKYDIDSKAKII